MERRTNAASDQTKYALAVTLKELIAFADTVLRSRFSARGCTGRRKSKNSSAGAPRRSFGAHFLRKKRILCLTNGKVQGTINT